MLLCAIICDRINWGIYEAAPILAPILVLDQNVLNVHRFINMNMSF